MATSFINTKALAKRIDEVQEELKQLLHLFSFTDGTTKRGRPAKATKKATAKPAKAPKKAKGKRGAMGEAIAAFLASKGKAGAHVKDIASEIGKPVPNVTSFFYSPGGKAKYKNLGKATFALRK